METIHVIGGGTVFHVRPHLALAAVAYGKTATRLEELFADKAAHPVLGPEAGLHDRQVVLHLTRMARAGKGDLETNQDIDKLLTRLVADPDTRMIVMSVAVCDFEGAVDGTPSGKDQPRLKTSAGDHSMRLTPSEKLLGKIRRHRKDIFLVGFKTTAGAIPDEQYLAGLDLLKRTSCNLVLVNDLHTRLNMIVAPELARYAEGQDRDAALRMLVDMADARSRLTFTRTTVVDGRVIDWDSDRVPAALRKVVDWLTANGAYRAFNDVTVGHFAYREAPGVLLSSRRRKNYNRRQACDLVRVEFQNGTMLAYGDKPSAGTRSQYAVLSQYPEYDCVVHFHCRLKPGSKVNVRPQRELECGSHECGQNTLAGIARHGSLAAVMLDQHGPNIIFSSKADPQEVIDFIRENFDLSVRSDGIR